MSFRDRVIKAFKSMGIKVTDPRILAGPELFENINEDPAGVNLERMVRAWPWRKDRKFIQPNPDRSKMITTGDFDTHGNFFPRRTNDDHDHDDEVKEKPKKVISMKRAKEESPEDYLARLRREVEELELRNSVKKSKKVYKSRS